MFEHGEYGYVKSFSISMSSAAAARLLMRTDMSFCYLLRASLQLTKIFGYFCKKVTKENKAEMYPADYFVLFIF